MSSGEIRSKWFKGKWHFPAVYSGIALIITAAGIALYNNAPAVIAWWGVKNGHLVIYEEGRDGRKVFVNPVPVPQVTPADTYSSLAQNAPKPDVEVAVGKKGSSTPDTAARSEPQNAPTESNRQIGTTKGAPQTPKVSKIARVGPPMSIVPLPKDRGTVRIEVPAAAGSDSTDPPPRGAYSRDGMVWIQQNKKCEQYGNEPMDFLACHLRPNKRPIVRGW
jgi:hypothetical protein